MPFGMRVDVERLAADEAAERDAGFAREVDGQARRRRHGGDQRDTGEQRLLHQLERGPARYLQHRPRQRQPPFEQHAARDLVHGVVPARRPPPSAAAGRRDRTGRPRAARRWPRTPAARRGACPASTDTTAAGTVHGPSTVATRARSDSMVRRPHRPHEAVIITWRRLASRSSSRATALAGHRHVQHVVAALVVGVDAVLDQADLVGASGRRPRPAGSRRRGRGRRPACA